jgi:hypothetical protein
MRAMFCDIGLHVWERYHCLMDAIVCGICGHWYPCERRWQYESSQHITTGLLSTADLPYADLLAGNYRR